MLDAPLEEFARYKLLLMVERPGDWPSSFPIQAFARPSANSGVPFEPWIPLTPKNHVDTNEDQFQPRPWDPPDTFGEHIPIESYKQRNIRNAVFG
jgi:hypothetical protein